MKNTLALLSSIVFFSCATLSSVPEEQFSIEIHEKYCEKNTNETLSGEGRVNFQLPDLQGEYPADLVVSPEKLIFQVTDPFGGVIASLEKKGEFILIQDQGKRKKKVRANVTWRGIPLQGMERHFLAKPSCETRFARVMKPFGVVERNGKKETHFLYKKTQTGWLLSQWKATYPSGEVLEVKYEQFQKTGIPSRVSWKTSQGMMMWQWKE